MSVRNLSGHRIFLSASVPDELSKNQQKLQDRLYLISSLTEQICKRNGTLVFGGHPSVTPLIHQAASSMLSPSEDAVSPAVELFQLGGFKSAAPSQVADTRIFPKVTWVGSHMPDQTQEFAKELEEMRQGMVKGATAAIFVGGKRQGFLGDKPGIRREYNLFTEQHPDQPAYLVGLLDGETSQIIEDLEAQHKQEKNGLNDLELWKLHYSEDIDLIVNLIVADLIAQSK